MARTLSHFDDVYEPMEADRQLLFELRKDLPETRPEAEAQLERMRSLALAADPARLGQLVDRVGEAAPDFLDWRFGDYASDAEAAQAYLDSGASAFDTTIERVPQRGAPDRRQSARRDPHRHRPASLRGLHALDRERPLIPPVGVPDKETHDRFPTLVARRRRRCPAPGSLTALPAAAGEGEEGLIGSDSSSSSRFSTADPPTCWRPWVPCCPVGRGS